MTEDVGHRRVFVLTRTDGKSPTKQSFHSRRDCGRLASAFRRAEAGTREIIDLSLAEAADLEATKVYGFYFGTLGPCRACWPHRFVDAVYLKRGYRKFEGDTVLEAARRTLGGDTT